MQDNRSNRAISLLTTTAFLIVTLAGPVGANAAAPPSGLEMIPANAPMAVIVPSLANLNVKTAKLNAESLDSVVPQMADLLGSLKLMSGINNGLNDDGTLVVIFTNFDALTGHRRPDQPPVIILAPVSDYAAFVANFGGDANEAITAITLSAGSDGFSKKLGSYAVIGPTWDQVERFEAGNASDVWMEQIGKTGGRCLAKSDLSVILNVQAMEPVLKPKLQAAVAQIQRDMAQMNDAPPAMANLVKSIAAIYGDAATALLRDTSAVTFGLDLSSQGVGLTYTTQFEPTSYLAQVFTDGRGTTDQLARLPNHDYWLATAMNFRGIAVNTLTKDLLARIGDDQEDPATAPVLALFKNAAALAQQTTGLGAVYAVPTQPGMMGGTFLSGVAVYETHNGQAYTKLIQDYFGQIQTLLDLINETRPSQEPNAPHQPNTPANPMKVTMQYTPNALQVDGVQVDEYQIQYQLPPQAAQEMGPAAPMMMMLLGNAGQNGYVVAQGRHVVMTTTRDVQLVKQTLAAIGNTKGLGASGPIDRVRRTGLPPQTVLESYLSIPGMISGVNLFMAMMGQPPIQVPDDLPPVAVATSLEDHSVTGRLYVPTAVIRFCKDATNQVMSMMQPPQEGEPNGAPPSNQAPQSQGPPPAPF